MTHPHILIPNRRRALRLGAATVLAASPFARLARAQGGAPLKIVVGYAAGGSSDQSARLLADQLREHLGRSVIVDNRTGAAGRLMLGQVKAAKPDGDTLAFVAHGQMTLFQHIYTNLPYDPTKDFSPVARLCNFNFAFATGPATSAKTMAAYSAWARDPAHKASYATPGLGTVPHFIGKLMAERAGLNMVDVPYRGAAPSVTDLMGGAVSAAVTPVSDVLQYDKAGRLRTLATSGSRRSPFLPDAPTLKEAGIDLAVDGWYGLYAPTGTPPDTVARLNDAIRKSAPALKEPLARMALQVDVSSPTELAELQRTESAFWAQTVKATGFMPQS